MYVPSVPIAETWSMIDAENAVASSEILHAVREAAVGRHADIAGESRSPA
jgi:hypothetical protein